MMKFPLLVFVFSFIALWLSVQIGDYFRKRLHPLEGDSGKILVWFKPLPDAAGLLIGFTFSMAVSRYDLRKNYEEAEANAIGTEYVRADLLPEADAQECVSCSGNISISECFSILAAAQSSSAD